MAHRFAKMPVEVFMDGRLGLRHLKVLGAIISFADAKGCCHPKRHQIANICGIRESDISSVTTQLCAFGWLEKIGSGGRSTALDYIVKTPFKTVLESRTVLEDESCSISKQETVPESSTLSGEKQYQNPVPFNGETVPESSTVYGENGTGIQYGLEKETVLESSTPINTTDHNTYLRIESSTTPQSVVAASPQTDLAGIEAQDEKTQTPEIEKTITAKPAKKPPLTPEMREACTQTWNAYSVAFENRYGVAPVKNAKVAGQVVNFVKRIGQQEAKHVAAFYLTHGARWYVQTGHSVDALLRDAEKLRMEWATNRTITDSSARHEDKRQSASGTLNEYMNGLEARYGTQ